MRKLIFIPFLFFCLILSGTTYYVSTTGDNDDPGTLAQPWATWGKAFTSASPGDTVFFRGGIYPHTISDGDGYTTVNSGTLGNLIYYWAYPPDFEAGNKPILDSDDVVPTSNNHFGIRCPFTTYVHFKGLTVRNVWSVEGGIGGSSVQCYGWRIGSAGVITENCTVYNVHGVGFQTYGVGNYINCDAHDCCDSLAVAPQKPGERGTGFAIVITGSTTSPVYYKDCRAWNCGDQGFSAYSTSYMEWDGCWSFRNGQLEAGGHGFKLGFVYIESWGVQRAVQNCIMAYNREAGLTCNDNGTNAQSMHIYNNTSYQNLTGFRIYNTSSSDAEELKRIFKNNIGYANTGSACYVASNALYTHETNSWDTPPGITLTESDFLSVDSTGITAARQADGSLPDNDCYNKFLKLSSTSQVYQAGTYVGLTYDAVDSLWRNPPSLGFKEYYAQETPEEPKVLSELSTKTPYWQTETTAISGGNVYDDGGGTVSARGVCWNTTGLPTTADDKTTDGTGTGEFWSQMTGLSQDVTYYVRAYAINEIGPAYGNQMTFRTFQIEMVDEKPVVVDGKPLIIP